ncbi:hypothetical protein M5K25_025057 [Dendrobium thyrsiflorum]|uniref:Uncharacterized protein n=1 Tax=Dendrobium thyrsiflorum TaxID=117978 RepID=A0ABD0U3F9_DENTH
MKTITDIKAWTKSTNLILYFLAVSAGRDSGLSTTQKPVKVANPCCTLPAESRKLSLKLSIKQERMHINSKQVVMNLLAEVQWPWLARMGERSWKASTVPVGNQGSEKDEDMRFVS